MASVSTCTTFTPTALAFYDLILIQVFLRHPTYAACSERGIGFLYALQAAQIFEAVLLPFRYQIGVGIFLTEAEFIQLPGYGLLFIKLSIYVSGHLVVKLKNRPQNLRFAFSFTWCIFNISHFYLEFCYFWFDDVPACWFSFRFEGFYFGHIIFVGLFKNNIK